MFDSTIKQKIISAIAKYGLTGGQKVLKEEGISVSIATMCKFAKEAKIKLSRGRKPQKHGRGRPLGSRNQYVKPTSFVDKIMAILAKNSLSFPDIATSIRENGYDYVINKKFYIGVYRDLCELVKQQKVKINSDKVNEVGLPIKMYSLY